MNLCNSDDLLDVRHLILPATIVITLAGHVKHLRPPVTMNAEVFETSVKLKSNKNAIESVKIIIFHIIELKTHVVINIVM